MDNPNNSKDNWEADNESDIELDNGIKDRKTPEQWIMSAVPNVPRLIQTSCRSKETAEKVLMMVNTIETRRNKGTYNIYSRMGQCIFTRSCM